MLEWVFDEGSELTRKASATFEEWLKGEFLRRKRKESYEEADQRPYCIKEFLEEMERRGERVVIREEKDSKTGFHRRPKYYRVSFYQGKVVYEPILEY